MVIYLVYTSQVQMGESFEKCNNLTVHPELKINVSKEVNMFNMNRDLYSRIPPLLLAFISGNLFDNLPKRPILFLPIIAGTIITILHFINFTFFYELPVEFLYFTMLYHILGGTPLYYLGQYGYVCLVAKQEETGPPARRQKGTHELHETLLNSSAGGGLKTARGGHPKRLEARVRFDAEVTSRDDSRGQHEIWMRGHCSCE